MRYCHVKSRVKGAGTREGWQVHLDSGPMPKGEFLKQNILIDSKKSKLLLPI